MPPAVALLNYISSVILWRIFCQTGTFRGVFLYILFAGRISEAAMGGAGVGGYNMINMTITELRTALSRIFFQNWNFRGIFSI